MKQQQVKDMLWLLQVSKQNLPYTSQWEQWNRIQAEIRQEIATGSYGTIEDYTGNPFDYSKGPFV